MNKSMFPKNFLWGTATSAHQVEGHNTYNDFWAWENSTKTLPKSGIACNQHILFREDFKLIKDVLHNNAHRISIEWSRIEPREGDFNKTELEHYKQVIFELIKLKIEPIVTLHHFTNPVWFAQKGGWIKSKNVNYFKRFVSMCLSSFGNKVKYWIVINEPSVYVQHAYIDGLYPPHKRNLILAMIVLINLAKAHNEAIKLIHQTLPNALVSSANPMIYIRAKGRLNRILIKPLKFITNYFFIWLTKNCNNFIGINHYFVLNLDILNFIKFNQLPPYDLASNMIFRKAKNFGWSNKPEGLYHVVMDTWHKYKLPILVTENGIADTEDSLRPKYIKQYISKLQKSILEGANVIGYLHWSLLDNFEWGIKNAHFGLFKTNFVTQKRIPRKSAILYGKIAKTNGEYLYSDNQSFVK